MPFLFQSFYTSHAQYPHDDDSGPLGCSLQCPHHPHKPLINQATLPLDNKGKGRHIGIKIKHIGEIGFSKGLVIGLAASNQCFCCLPFLLRQLVGCSNHFISPFICLTLFYQLKAFGQFLPNLLLLKRQ